MFEGNVQCCSRVAGWVWAGAIFIAGVLAVLFWLGFGVGSASAQEQTGEPDVATTFIPEITITVPQVDINGDGINDFSGTFFRHRIMVAQDSDAGCGGLLHGERFSSLSWSLKVVPSGLVESHGLNWRQSLIGRPAGVEKECIYEIRWPTFQAGEAVMVRRSGPVATVSYSNRVVSADYVAGTVASFSPEVNISVPDVDTNGDGVNDFSGTNFEVFFRRLAGSNSACSHSEYGMYTVQSDGSVAVHGEAPVLVDRTVEMSSEGCSYSVRWPTVVGFVLQPGASDAVNYTARSISASYASGTVLSFSPEVNISVPEVDVDNDGVNDLSGTEFVIKFDGSGSIADGCYSFANATYVVQDSGAVEVSGEVPVLAFKTVGEDWHCSYELTWPTVPGLVRKSGYTTEVTSERYGRYSSIASASYVAGSVVWFSPDVDISVPNLDADGNSENDFAGTQFLVQFRRSPKSGAECTAFAGGTYVVQNSGDVTVSGDEPVLVDRSIGMSALWCEYNVSWPTVAGLVLDIHERKIVGFSSLNSLGFPRPASVASANYRAGDVISFSPDVNISVPAWDANNDGANDLAGTLFAVEFRRAFGHGDRCTLSANGVYVVQDNGEVVVSGAEPVLVDRTVGETEGCEYEVIWPNIGGLEHYYIWQPNTTRVHAARKTVSIRYNLSTRTIFFPRITITVPRTDADSDGTNDFSGTRFVVEFSPATGSPSGCSGSQENHLSGSYTVQDSGLVTRDQTGSGWLNSGTGWMVDRPGGLTSRCSYDVMWPTVEGLARQSGATMILKAAGREISAVYVAGSESTSLVEELEEQTSSSSDATVASSFSPIVEINIPWLDADNNNVSDFSGTQFMVSFKRVFGTNAVCTDSLNGIYVVQDDGDVMVAGTDPILVDRPVGVTTNCIYVVGWPAVEGLIYSHTIFSASSVNAFSKTARATYQSTVDTTFSPIVNIMVPQVDADSDGENDFAGTQFVVKYTLTINSNWRCGNSALTGTYVVRDNGQVTVLAAEPVLINRPARQHSDCEYNLTWPVAPGLELQIGASTSVSASNRAISASYVAYVAPATTFSPKVVITVPQLDAGNGGVNDFSGIRFVVLFRRVFGTSAECTNSASATYEVQNSGDVSETSAAVLVDRPAGLALSCIYAVTWPSFVTLVPLSGATTSVSASARTVSASYGALLNYDSFFPTAIISVPQIDANADDANDFAGTEIPISFSPTALSHRECGYTSNYIVGFQIPTGKYVVKESGTVAVVSAHVRHDLVSYVTGASSICVYDVIWPDVAGLVLQPDATATVSYTVETISASYVAATVTTFSPTVNISVPQTDAGGDGVNDFAGTSVAVTFSRVSDSSSDCSASVSGVYVVQNNGDVELTGTAPMLVDYPARSADGCVYDVAWPDVTGWDIQPGASNTVQGSARIVSAGFAVSEETAATTFSPMEDITVPQLDADGDGVNDFSGVKFQVGFAQNWQLSGGSGHCSDTIVKTYVVQDSGDVVVSGTKPVLIDRSAGATLGCVYNVVLLAPDGLTRPNLYPFSFLSAANRTLSVHFLATPASTFIADVSISVPQTDANGDGNNDFSGTRFEVTFRRVFGSNVGCTDSASGTYVVRDNGVVTVAGAELVLVNRPVGGIVRKCEYAVVWPTIAGFTRKPGSTTTVSSWLSYVNSVVAADKTASASYEATDPVVDTAATSFSPTVDISVPQLDADGDGVNDFAGTGFVVTFRRVFGSDVGCTSSASRTYVVQNDGTVSGADLSLVDRPAGVSSGCSYAITWPSVAGLVRQTGATSRVSASTKSASASYSAIAATSFTPDVVISVPRLDADRDGVNDFSGRRFVVTFRRVFGSDAGCTSLSSRTYVVRSDGTVSGAGPSLVDRPAGSTTGCIYVVGWPAVTDLVRQSGATATVSASARSAAATYQTGSTYVAPVPAAEEPEVEEPEVGEPETEEPEPESQEPAPAEPTPGVEEPVVEQAQSPVAVGSAGGGAVGGGGNAGTANAGVGASGGGVNAGIGSGSGTVADSGVGVSGSVPGAPVPEVGVIQLSRGWVMLPFNGPSGMTPADFASALEGAINSVWVWDLSAQQWQGWTASRGSFGLTGLVPGDVVMVYAPAGGTVVYSPADLLGHRVGVNSWTLAPTGISLVVYGGGTATSASDVFASYANSAVVVYLWDSQNQRWEYHLPGRQPLSSVQVPWFSDINPGDAMFVYNISPTAVTIPWE